MAKQEPKKIPLNFQTPVDYAKLTDAIGKHLPEHGLIGQVDVKSPPNYQYMNVKIVPPWPTLHYLRDIQMVEKTTRVTSAVLWTFTAPDNLPDLVNAELRNVA